MKTYIVLIISVFSFIYLNCRPEANQKLEPSFSSISRNIFIKKCSLYTCHSSASFEKSGNLDLSDKESYNNLINFPSSSYPEIKRIVPGKPDESLLLQRLEGKVIIGVPLERNCVTKKEIETIREWIKNGAKP
ncbi:MAG: hypothetical protein AB1498_05375 [bacterium]